MADGFIVRKGGVTEEVLRTTAPSINFVSKTDSEIVVTFTNNDAAEAEIYYGITSTLTDTVTLATAATSSNITFSGLVADTAFTVSAYALVTDPTSKKIKSEIVTTVITTDNPVFTAATGGTTLEYDSGGKRFRSHTFTSDGNFVVSTVGDATDDRNKVDYLIIAGGGGGGASFTSTPRLGGGGGAGGYRTTLGTSGENSSAESKVTVTASTFEVFVGASGAGASSLGDAGTNGSTSSALGITTVGGGGGGGTNNRDGQSGGSGGGASFRGNEENGGSGTALEGFNGSNSSSSGSGGGGGAGSVGTVTNGGNGVANLLRTSFNETRALGGNGTSSSLNITGASASANTGSGGDGGSTGGLGGNGGSGIVVIRYEITTSV